MRYITPDDVMRTRFDKHPRPEWDAAVLCFRVAEGSQLIINELGAKPLGYKVLWGMDEYPDQPIAHELAIGSHRVGVIGRCHWGGPQTAIFVEELAHLGVKAVLGVGAAGSLVPDLPKGTQVVARSAIATDGTSRAYTDEDNVHAGRDLASVIRAAEQKHDWRLRPVCTATVDAIYRETEELLRTFLGHGAEAINMETGPLYAAAAVCGVDAIWIGHISDCLVNGMWESWEDLGDMAVASGRIALDILEVMFGSDGHAGA